MPIISMRDVVKEYPATKRGAEPVRAIDHVSLEVERGDVFGVIGYSGAGKSTLVRLINALEPATSGSIRVEGTELVGLGEAKLLPLRQDIGMIFQQFNLFSSRTVGGNVAFPMKIAGVEKSERERRVAELLDFVGLGDRANAYPEQLSGGQKQRVGIARALSTNPKILLADESTSALDPQTTADVLDLLERVNRQFGITIIVITHEMEVIKRLATKVAVMEAGRIVEQGDVYDLFANPQHPATRRFVSTIIPGVPEGDELKQLREEYEGVLATISVDDTRASRSEVLGRLVRAGIDAELIYGGVQSVGGRTFGHLTLALHGDGPKIRAGLESVSTIAQVTVLDTGDASVNTSLDTQTISRIEDAGHGASAATERPGPATALGHADADGEVAP